MSLVGSTVESLRSTPLIVLLQRSIYVRLHETLIVTSDIIPQTVGEETAEVCHYILDLLILFIARTVRRSYLKINLNSRKIHFIFVNRLLLFRKTYFQKCQ